MNTYNQLEALARAVSADSGAQTIARLETILSTWMRTGTMPDEVGVLSSGEYKALMLAADCEDLLGRSPVREFLVLDGWLQKWVMETRGWKGLIGMPVGV